MQQQFLRSNDFEGIERFRGYRPFLAAAVALVALVALVGCGSAARQVHSASPVSSADRGATGADKSPPIPPSSEVMTSDEIVIPSFDPAEGLGTPILETDKLAQPLGIDGMAVGDLTKAPFKAEFISSISQAPKLFAFSDYSLVGLVYDDTPFGSLVVKEGTNPQPLDFDAIVKAVDDPTTPERYGVDASNGHAYLGVDTKYGTALVQSVNGYVSIEFNLPDSVFVEITGVDKLLTMDLASKLASTAQFSPAG